MKLFEMAAPTPPPLFSSLGKLKKLWDSGKNASIEAVSYCFNHVSVRKSMSIELSTIRSYNI